MKIEFYRNNDKKKRQIIKCDKEQYINIAKLAKCELLIRNNLKDLDFSDGQLMCIIKDKKYNMKELFNLISSKLNADNKKACKEDKKNKKSDKKKSNDSKGKKKKSKNKKSSKKKEKTIKERISVPQKNKEESHTLRVDSEGRIKLTRKNKNN